MDDEENQKDRAERAVAQWAQEFPNWDLAPMELLGRLRELATVIERDHYTPLFATFGLQPGEFDVLATLRRVGTPYELTPTALFDVTMTSSGGMTARLDRLEKMGFIERRPNPDDRRGTLVRLTKSAVELIDRVVPEHLSNQSRLTECLETAERAEVSSLLKKLLRHIQEVKPEVVAKVSG